MSVLLEEAVCPRCGRTRRLRFTVVAAGLQADLVCVSFWCKVRDRIREAMEKLLG